jgi:hypothetical protein
MKLYLALALLCLAGSATAACYTSVQTVPVTCTAPIVSDTNSGCRQVTCTNSAGSITVLGCNKPSDTSPQYFELYKQSSSGSIPTACFGDTCISSSGYAKSNPLPYCTATNTTNGTNSTPNTPGVSQIRVDVRVNNTRNLAGAQFDMRYDTAALRFDRVTEGTFLDNAKNEAVLLNTTNVTNGTVKTVIVLRLAPGGVNGSGLLASVYFNATKNFSAPQLLNIVLSNSSAQPAAGALFFIVNGTFNGSQNGTNSTPPTNTTQPPANTTNSTNATNACYNRVQDLPLNCSGVTIQDIFNGCRNIICAQGNNNLTVLACDKTGSFEMYKQSQSGAGVSVCLANVCIADNGFAKGTYPVCVGNGTGTNTTQPPTNTTNTTQPASNTTKTVTVQIAPWYPKGRDYIFQCNTNGFTPTTYDWLFGDGNKQLNSNNKDVYYVYATAGNYVVSCTARNAQTNATGTLAVQVS